MPCFTTRIPLLYPRSDVFMIKFAGLLASPGEGPPGGAPAWVVARGLTTVVEVVGAPPGGASVVAGVAVPGTSPREVVAG